jgi:hypothetical protein
MNTLIIGTNQSLICTGSIKNFVLLMIFHCKVKIITVLYLHMSKLSYLNAKTRQKKIITHMQFLASQNSIKMLFVKVNKKLTVISN